MISTTRSLIARSLAQGPRHRVTIAQRRRRFSLEALEERALLSTVTTTADDGPGSLRAAIVAVDNGSDPGPITFNIAASGVQTINVLSPLPALTVPVTIDATTQPGYAGKPLVELNGSAAGAGAYGLVVAGGGSVVKGLAVDRFDGANLVLQGGGGNVVQADFLGTNPAGTLGFGASNVGLLIQGGSSGNLIGTNADGVNDAAERNVISGNAGDGVLVTGGGTTGNTIAGNFIGTDVTGTKPLGNGSYGIQLDTAGNTVGGALAAQVNVVSANFSSGIYVSPSATGNVIAGNRVGTDVTGTKKLSNFNDGVTVDGSGNTIGGTTAGAGNLLSGNFDAGILLDPGATANVIQGNTIGANLAGTKALGNNNWGIMDEAGGNTIGGVVAGAGNQISANLQSGIDLYGASGDLVAGNRIGTDVTGTLPLSNSSSGVKLENGATGNTIGAPGLGANIIAFNNGLNLGGAGGVVVMDSSTANAIEFNSIHDNNGLGIDLGGDGVTPNANTGTGPNASQPYPVIVSAAPSGGTTTVTGTVSGPAGAPFVLDFYVDAAPDPSNYGEGQTYVGSSQTLTWDASGNATFSVTLPFALASGQYLSATATGPNGTSEFSLVASAKAVPIITWPTPDPIAYGTPLSATQLDATASVPGTFAYNPPLGTVLNAGSNDVLTVTFTPNDTADYTSATASVALHVLRLASSFTTLDSPTITYGDPSVVLAGQVAAGSFVPDGDVTVTFNGTTQWAPIDATGHFSTTFSTVGLPASATSYPITYEYNGSLNFLDVIDTTHGVLVNPKALSVSADDASRVYGAPNPTFTGELVGVVAGDGITATFTTTADASSGVGTYPIVPVLADPNGKLSNYTVTSTNGTLTITPAPLTITADNQTSVFGAPLPALTVSYAGFVNGDTAASLATLPVASTTATPTSPVAGSPYPITVAGASAANYQITYVAGAFTITPAGTTLQLTSSSCVAAYGRPITFSAATAVVAPGAGTPTGSVAFYDGTTLLGSSPLSNGVATLSVSTLCIGIHSISAAYAGDGNFQPSQSGNVPELVVPAALLYVLDAHAAGALSLGPNAQLSVAGGVVVDSGSSNAVLLRGNAQLTADCIELAGNCRVSSNATMNPSPTTGAAATPDPLAGLAAPTAAQAGPVRGAVDLRGNASLTINPGIYSAIRVSGNATLTLNPGIYVLTGGLTVLGNAHVNGSGVLLYNAGPDFTPTHSAFGGISVLGNASISLSPAASGPYAGVLLFQARDNASPLIFNSAALAGFQSGTVYAPAALLAVAGNAQVTTGQVIVDELLVTGNGLGIALPQGNGIGVDLVAILLEMLDDNARNHDGHGHGR